VLLLGYDCFEFIKILVKNRDMVLYCTLLLTSQTDLEKEKLVETMKKKSNLKKILDQVFLFFLN
jgi:pre-mRNA-splicing helicase BRR2